MSRKAIVSALVAAAVAAAVVLGFLYLKAPPATPIRPGSPAPDLELPALDGGRGRLIARAPATVLVFFDSSWPVMERYGETLERLYRKYYRRGLRMVGVSLDADAEKVRAFVRARGITFTVLHDPRGTLVAPHYGIPRTPELYVIDAAGQVRASHAAPFDWRQPRHRGPIEALLPSPSPGAW